MKSIKDQIQEHAGDSLDRGKEPGSVVVRKGRRGALPKSPEEKLIQYTFSANIVDYREIQDAARGMHVDFSTFVRMAVMDYIRRQGIGKTRI